MSHFFPHTHRQTYRQTYILHVPRILISSQWKTGILLFSGLASSGRPKEDFCLSAESRKRTYPKSYFLQKYRKNRKRLYLPKDPLSAEIASFGREKLLFWPIFGSKFLPKDCLSAEIASSCQKSLFLQKDRKAQKMQKDFLPNFCRNALSVYHYKLAYSCPMNGITSICQTQPHRLQKISFEKSRVPVVH